MNATEAAQMARDHFYGVPGMLPDLGFETAAIYQVNDTWVVDGSVFSLFTSKMVDYTVRISGNTVTSIGWG